MIVTVTLNVAIDKRLVVPEFRYGEVMRVTECNYTAGGKGLNVAKVAAIAGERVAATGFIGGHAGAYVVERLSDSGIESSFISVPGETRSCINLYDEATGRQTELLEPGIFVPPQKVEEFVARYTDLITPAKAVALSGSVPRGVPADIYFRLIQIAREQQKPVLLDTSGALLEEGIKALPTLIKPNSDEIRTLLHKEKIADRSELIDAAKELHARGIPIVVVSLGKEGALVVCDSGVYQGTTPDIEIVNTVGCGDSMVAAFAVGIARGEPMEAVIRRAMAVSTANALCLETGYYRPRDYERLMEQVGVRKLT